MSAPIGSIHELETAAPVKQGNYPCLILNADYQPLSYFPLSLWSWQDAVKAVFLDRVNVVDHYEQCVRSTNFEMQIPRPLVGFAIAKSKGETTLWQIQTQAR